MSNLLNLTRKAVPCGELVPNLLDAIVLGLIQGIAEWLPISSTGHLRLYEYFRGLKVPLLYDITLHMGTLAVILVFFRKDIKRILSALVHLDFKTEHGRLIPLIIVGSVPTALIGYVFRKTVESIFLGPLPIGIALSLCGVLLVSSRMAHEKTDQISYLTAIVFGIAQGVSIIPGLSRSGTTIAVALLLGLKRERAFRFSFLLSIPAIIGAEALTAYDQRAALAQSGFGMLEIAVGVAVTTITGYFALKLLHNAIENRKFHLFAFYCWLFGLFLVMLGLSGF